MPDFHASHMDDLPHPNASTTLQLNVVHAVCAGEHLADGFAQLGATWVKCLDHCLERMRSPSQGSDPDREDAQSRGV